MRGLQTWKCYPISKDFVIHSGHGSLEYLKGQHKLKKDMQSGRNSKAIPLCD